MLTAQCVREHDTGLTRIDSVAETSREQSNAEHEGVTQYVEAGAEPLLDGDSHVVRAVLEVQTRLGLLDEVLLFAVGTDRAQARQCFCSEKSGKTLVHRM